ncbi:hypothetical protein EDD22DRAFT_959069 [Suillus occidentalis]|nr:hypothetical protein EDD22DRAFT_959069 [Suillus occidentalis]
MASSGYILEVCHFRLLVQPRRHSDAEWCTESMQAHVKRCNRHLPFRNAHLINGAMRPPVVGNIASPSLPTVMQQSSHPRAASTNAVNGDHAGTPTSVWRFSQADRCTTNGIATNNTTTINGTAHQSTDVRCLLLLILLSPISPAHQRDPRPNPNMYRYLSHSVVTTFP